MGINYEKVDAKIAASNNIENTCSNQTGNSNETNSIFTTSEFQLVQYDRDGILKQLWENVKNKQGFIGNSWDNFKNFTGFGLGSNDIEDKIKQYENGEISYEEVLASVQAFEAKQDSMVDLAANVTASLAVAGSAVWTGGTSLIAGPAIGGTVKMGIKTADRATNQIDGDALDAKQMIKDGVTGAVDGAITAATAGFIKTPVLGQSVGKAVVNGAVQGAKAGAISGSVSASTSYTINAIVEEDVDFSCIEYLKTTAQGTIVGGAFGGVFGGAAGGLAQAKLNTPEVRELAANLGMKDGNIYESEVLSNFLSKNKKIDINELNKYIENVDNQALSQAVPSINRYSPEQKLNFYDYHYKAGTTIWDASTLSLDDDLTQFLKNNYLDADGLSELLDKYPMTNRQVGEIPKGWLDAVSPEKQAAAQKEIYEAISKFQVSSCTDDLAADLTKILGKDVKIELLGSGCIGTGYKVSIDGAEDTCLKIFDGNPLGMIALLDGILKKIGYSDEAIEAFKVKQIHKITNMHGGHVEVQTGLFVNEHSDDFVKMYFGKVAGANDTDAFLVTQYLGNNVTPVSTGGKGGYVIKSRDAFTKESFLGKRFGGIDHNIISGKIIDFGAVKVKSKASGY